MNANGVESGPAPRMDGYEVLRWLGGGAQGSVWLVAPAKGGTPLAAKCFFGEVEQAGGGGLAVRRNSPRHNASEITQEWRILSNYEHEHLIKVHGVISLDDERSGGRALLMDYVAGGSVRDIVAGRGTFSVGEAVTMLTPMGQVLAFLHGHGVIHGDISPGNVLITTQGKPVLGDLGFASLVGQSRQSLGGTPGYISTFDQELSAASDVFALAAVGWYVLTGNPPPPTQDRMPLSMYVPGIPVELTSALEAGLADSPSQRPTAAAFAQAVFRSARAEPFILAQSVHPSVLPDLLTRRAARAQREGIWARAWGSRRPLLRVAKLRGSGRRTFGRRWWIIGAVIAAGIAGIGCGALILWNPKEQTTAIPATPASSTLFAKQPLSGISATPLVSKEPVTQSPVASVPVTPDPLAVTVPADIRAGLMSAEPATALKALAWVRSYAFSSTDFALLETVNAPGSPAMLADRKIARALEKADHSYSGLETTLASTKVSAEKLISEGSDAPSRTVTIASTVTTSPFAEIDAKGAVVYQQVDLQKQTLEVVLIRLDSRWVIQEILPVPR